MDRVLFKIGNLLDWVYWFIVGKERPLAFLSIELDGLDGKGSNVRIRLFKVMF